MIFFIFLCASFSCVKSFENFDYNAWAIDYDDQFDQNNLKNEEENIEKSSELTQ